MNNKLSREEVERIIDPHYEKITTAIAQAFGQYLELSRAQSSQPHFILNKRTIASLIHDFTRSRIRESFMGTDGITVRDLNRLFLLCIDNQVYIRFKKIKHNFATSSIQTQQTKDFDNQDIEFDNFSIKPTLLYAGYVLDETWTSIRNFYIIYREGKDIIWMKDLTGTVEQTALSFVEVPETIEPLVRIRQISANKNVANIE